MKRRPRTLSADKADRQADELVLGRTIRRFFADLRLRGVAAPRDQFVGDFNHRMPAGRAHILARVDALIGKPLAFGDAHPLDRRLVPIRRQVAGDCDRADLFVEESQTQSVYNAPLIEPRHRVQAVLAENIEIRHGFRIEGVIG
jgi:hypothetical protein